MRNVVGGSQVDDRVSLKQASWLHETLSGQI